jgi:8-oxo-dGTP diphosphatase
VSTSERREDFTGNFVFLFRLMDDTFAFMNLAEKDEKLAAGGAVLRRAGEKIEALLIHRPTYRDWTFPKGGLKDGEDFKEAALREVKEETGLDCRILRKVAVSRYDYRTRKGNIRPKAVHYFLMEAVSEQVQTDGIEVDCAEWLCVDEAGARLSYDEDRKVLALAMKELQVCQTES